MLKLVYVNSDFEKMHGDYRIKYIKIANKFFENVTKFNGKLEAARMKKLRAG
jgi:hypothetical protein